MRRLLLALTLLSIGIRQAQCTILPIPWLSNATSSTGAAAAACSGSDPLAAACLPSYDTSGVPSWMWATDMSTKPWQTMAQPTAGATGTNNVIKLACMRNENCYYQVHMQAPAGGLSRVQVEMSNLVNNRGGTFTISSTTLSATGGFDVGVTSYTLISTPTSIGTSGKKDYIARFNISVPYAVIDKIDPYFNQAATSFPFDVSAGNNQSLVFHIRAGTSAVQYPSGFYSGTINITTGTGVNLTTYVVPIILELGNWTMPSTSTLLSHNGVGGNDLGIQHTGSSSGTGQKSWYPSLCVDDGTCEILINRYETVFALDHHWNVCTQNVIGNSVGTVETYFGDLQRGTTNAAMGLINPKLPGVKSTCSEFALQGNSVPTAQLWKANFAANNKVNSALTPFNYLKDEPANQSDWDTLIANGLLMTGTTMFNLVTTTYERAKVQGATATINGYVAVIDQLRTGTTIYQSAQFLAISSHTFGIYWDCLSGDSCAPNVPGVGTGQPNHHADGNALNNSIGGEILYYSSATMELNSTLTFCWYAGSSCQGPQVGGVNQIWKSGGLQSQGQGTGDENEWMPGTPGTIGVATTTILMTIPFINSEIGHEKYEYYNVLAANGLNNTAFTQLNSFITQVNNFNEDPYNNGSFSGTITSARANAFCAVHQISSPGATCAF